MQRVGLLAGHKGVEVRCNFEKLYPHVLICIKPSSVVLFWGGGVALYRPIDNTALHTYVDVKENSLFPAKLAACLPLDQPKS
jgi:hypothetical protein